MKILLATDAWRPQVNGVVHTLERMSAAAREWRVEFDFLTPQGFSTLPLPTYPDIRVALATSRAVGRHIDASGADHVHISTEGPIGWATRHYCLRKGRTFTTSYHTRFPEYVAARLPVPLAWKRKSIGAKRPAWLESFAEVIGGRALLSRIAVDAPLPPLCAVSSPSRLATAEDPAGGCVISILDDGAQGAITLCGSGFAGTQPQAQAFLDELLQAV